MSGPIQNNRAGRRQERRRGHALNSIQSRVPSWVGRLRYILGIRAGHPWRSWSLKAIRRERLERWRHHPELEKDLRQIQVALAGYGVTP